MATTDFREVSVLPAPLALEVVGFCEEPVDTFIKEERGELLSSTLVRIMP